MGRVQIATVPSPAFFGLAKDRRDFPIGPEWATEALNIVIDSNGRLAARKGWVAQHGTEFDSGAATVQLTEFVDDDGTVVIVWSTADDLFRNSTNPTSIVGALTPTAGNWQFFNFNGFLLGWQTAHAPIQWSGSGNFAAITAASGTLPDGHCAHGAFGRVWAVDDDMQTIRYSALLDHTRWATADGGGSIDMRSVWPQGMDEVVAIKSFGSKLVVFGRRHIIIWQDASGSQLGLDPTQMYVSDAIDHIGAISRDAVVVVGEVDIVFWSAAGIRSLVRTLQERASPVTDMSPQNRNYIATGFSSSNLGSVRGVYSPALGLVIFLMPSLARMIVFDMRQPTQDGGYRVTEWEMNPMPSAFVSRRSNDLLLGFGGFIGKYEGYDDNDVAYPFQFDSGWVSVTGDENRQQALKALKAFLYQEQPQLVQFRWGVDFRGLTENVSRTIGEDNDPAEWNVFEWGIGEWGQDGGVIPVRVPLTREAEYVKLSVGTSVNGKVVALQPLVLYTKPMRAA